MDLDSIISDMHSIMESGSADRETIIRLASAVRELATNLRNRETYELEMKER